MKIELIFTDIFEAFTDAVTTFMIEKNALIPRILSCTISHPPLIALVILKLN